MFNRDDPFKQPREVPSYPMGSTRINELMPRVRAAVEGDTALSEKINDVRFLTTLAGDALVSITYNRPIDADGAWEAAATALSEALGPGPGGKPVKIVGRSRKVKIVVGGETVEETLSVAGRGGSGAECHYLQTEGAFSQPNAGVCEHMLAWAYAAAAPPPRSSEEEEGDEGEDEEGKRNGDLCELYCGNGCFTIALAPRFRRVIATELSRSSVALAERNIAANGLAAGGRVRVAKLSAEEFSAAYRGERVGATRLADAGIDAAADLAANGELRTLLVDPPRAGLDETCRGLARRFARVIYVSCNPETLARDVAELRATHRVTRLAAFDQFPYTPHLEAGVLLERRGGHAGGGDGEESDSAFS